MGLLAGLCGGQQRVVQTKKPIVTAVMLPPAPTITNPHRPAWERGDVWSNKPTRCGQAFIQQWIGKERRTVDTRGNMLSGKNSSRVCWFVSAFCLRVLQARGDTLPRGDLGATLRNILQTTFEPLWPIG